VAQAQAAPAAHSRLDRFRSVLGRINGGAAKASAEEEKENPAAGAAAAGAGTAAAESSCTPHAAAAAAAPAVRHVTKAVSPALHTRRRSLERAQHMQAALVANGVVPAAAPAALAGGKTAVLPGASKGAGGAAATGVL
jgi:hypothetical protein